MKLGLWNSIGSKIAFGSQSKALFPFSDGFSRPDGGLGNDWVGPTWAISGGKAINSPIPGPEIVANPGFTGTASWTAFQSSLAAIAGGQAGTCLELTRSLGTSQAAFQAVTLDPNKQYEYSGYAKSGTSGNETATVRAQQNSGGFATDKSIALTTSADWQKILFTVRPSQASMRFAFEKTSATAGTMLFDTASAKALTTSELFAIRNSGQINVDVKGTYSLLSVGTKIGVACNLKSDLSSGLVAWVDGLNIRLEKIVNGTWTTLINAAQVLSGGLLPQIKTNVSGANLLVDLFYNNVQIGTQQTVSDAEIVANTYVGLFNTYNGNQISSFTMLSNP